MEGEGTQVVLRFVAPSIARDAPSAVGAEAAAADLDWLCGAVAAPMLDLPYGIADTVVVTMMDRPVARGRVDPERTQYFGVYRVEAGMCRSEEF